jgi:hypothetical protein
MASTDDLADKAMTMAARIAAEVRRLPASHEEAGKAALQSADVLNAIMNHVAEFVGPVMREITATTGAPYREYVAGKLIDTDLASAVVEDCIISSVDGAVAALKSYADDMHHEAA